MLGEQFDKVAIVLSTGRTATKAIAHYFDTWYPEVVSRHEPFPSRPLRFGSNLYLADRISRRNLKSLIVLCRKASLARTQASIYLEANFYLHGCMEALDEVFRDVRVCHIVRHPGRQVTSYINFGVFRGLKGAVGRHVPYWLLKPENCDSDPIQRWNDMSERERLAWRWNVMNIELNRGEELLPGRYLRLKHEEMFSGPQPGITRLAKWLGLEPRDEMIEHAAKTPIHASQQALCPRWEHWDQESRAMLLERCGPLMQYYGYDTD